MNQEKYVYSSDSQNLIYTFFSVGKKGIITKVVVYEHIEADIFNLAFGDFNYLTGEIDDKVNSNNGDMIKVLATIIETVRDFFSYYPNAVVFIQGSTATRTKLYAKIIRDNIQSIELDFQVLAFDVNTNTIEKPDFTKECIRFVITKK